MAARELVNRLFAANETLLAEIEEINKKISVNERLAKIAIKEAVGDIGADYTIDMNDMFDYKLMHALADKNPVKFVETYLAQYQPQTAVMMSGGVKYKSRDFKNLANRLLRDDKNVLIRTVMHGELVTANDGIAIWAADDGSAEIYDKDPTYDAAIKVKDEKISFLGNEISGILFVFSKRWRNKSLIA